jgi:hypothetical protein
MLNITTAAAVMSPAALTVIEHSQVQPAWSVDGSLDRFKIPYGFLKTFIKAVVLAPVEVLVSLAAAVPPQSQ